MSDVHYEVRHRPVGDKIHVEAVLFHYTEMMQDMAPVSTLTGYPYNPLGSSFVQTFGVAVFGSPWQEYVGPPNWWERKQGKTWADKIAAAHRKVEAWAIRRVEDGVRAMHQVGIPPHPGIEPSMTIREAS